MTANIQNLPAKGEPVLRLRGISKNFGAVSALTDIDLDVNAGEVVALVGDNGAGKSTLVKVLAGVHQPSAGTIEFCGKAVTLDNPRLSIPSGDNRLRLEFDLGIGALGSRGDTSGHVALSSGLRYDARTQGLHLDAPELLQFDIPGSGALLEGSARGIFNSLLAELARNEPVYRLEPDLLSKLPAGKRIGDVGIERDLGLEPGSDSVERAAIGARLSSRRHHSRAELADDGLRDLGGRCRRGKIPATENEIPGAVDIVVTVEAVAIDHLGGELLTGFFATDPYDADRECEREQADGRTSGQGRLLDSGRSA